MVAVGMNKAADELLILDERTREDLASGKYRDQRRGSFGTSAASAVPAPRAAPPATGASGRPARRIPQQPPRSSPDPAPSSRPWTQRQEKLALIYNEQGLRPAEIARKLGVSAYAATQIILAARGHRKG
jgi:hypothetical protein